MWSVKLAAAISQFLNLRQDSIFFLNETSKWLPLYNEEMTVRTLNKQEKKNLKIKSKKKENKQKKRERKIFKFH